jgi:tetratricopeptide (TPR) repeat protein
MEEDRFYRLPSARPRRRAAAHLAAGMLGLLLFCPPANASGTPSQGKPGAALDTLSTAAWFFHNGHPEAAHAVLHDYLERDPGNTQVRLEYARMLAFAREYPEAIQQFQLVLRSEPSHPAATVGLAKVHSWQNRFASALELYEQVLARAPGHYDASVGKAFTLLWMGRREEAGALFQAAARRNPQDREVAAALQRLGLPAAVAPAPVVHPGPASQPAAPLMAAAPPAPQPAMPPSEPPPAQHSLQASVAAPAVGLAVMGVLLAYRRTVRRRRSGIPLQPAKVPLRLLAPRSARSAPEVHGAHVLLVEDDAALLRFMEASLQAAGARVVACRRGSQAALHLGREAFDVVLLDAGLSGEWTAADLRDWLRRNHPAGERGLVWMTEEEAPESDWGDAVIRLARPFTARDLAVITRLALSRARAPRRCHTT